MDILDTMKLDDLYEGIVQPADDFYNNTDTAYWVEHPLDFGDGSKEVADGMTADKDAEATKFKFLM